MLEFTDVTIQYGNTIAVQDFNLTINAGEIVSIVGESGSGKTTIIRSALGLLPGNGRVVAGDIRFDGVSLLKLSTAEWLTLRGNRLSMIFQDSGTMINPVRKIGAQFVEYIQTHKPTSKSEAFEKAKHMLAAMRLPDPERIMKSYPFELSGGQRQRVGIAFAMTFNPQLLLADEPTSALDVTTQAQIVRQMINLRREHHTGIVIVTHNLGVAAYMADRILVMREGRIVEIGTRDEILKHASDPYTLKLLDAVPTLEGERYV